MKHKILTTLTIILLTGYLSGCGSSTIKEPVKVPEKVYVEVPVECPALKKLDNPELPIDSLSEGSPNNLVAVSYTKSILMLENHIDKYEEIVETCKEKQQED